VSSFPFFLVTEVFSGSESFGDLSCSLSESSQLEAEETSFVIVIHGFAGTVYIFVMFYDLGNVPMDVFSSIQQKDPSSLDE